VTTTATTLANMGVGRWGKDPGF